MVESESLIVTVVGTLGAFRDQSSYFDKSGVELWMLGGEMAL